MRFPLILATVLTTGCVEKAVELRLEVAEDAVDLDVSCVDTVDVVVETAESTIETCLSISGAQTLADVQQQIRDKYKQDMPQGVLAISVIGQTGSTPNLCGTGMTVFYGADEYRGQDQLTLRMTGSLACPAMNTTSTYNVRPIDFMALVDTPAGAPPVCKTPLGIVDLSIGAIRPTELDLPNFWTSRMDWGVYADVNADGISPLPAWGEAEPTACLAIASDALFAASCIYPNTPSVCGVAGDVVVPIIRDTVAIDSLDQELFTEFPVMVLGAVFDTTTKKPVAGATITIDPARGRIVYADRGNNNRFDPKQVSATTTSGLFVAYMREPSVINVTEGTSKKVMRIGGPTGIGAAVIVPLR